MTFQGIPLPIGTIPILNPGAFRTKSNGVMSTENPSTVLHCLQAKLPTQLQSLSCHRCSSSLLFLLSISNFPFLEHSMLTHLTTSPIPLLTLLPPLKIISLNKFYFPKTLPLWAVFHDHSPKSGLCALPK